MAVVAGERERHGVGLVELERVVGLRHDVDTDDIEPGAVVAHCCAASAAEQVEEAGPGHGVYSRSRSYRASTAGAVHSSMAS